MMPFYSARCHSLLATRWVAISQLILAFGCTPRQVVRASGGRVHTERAIAGQAYAEYAQGRILEQQGDLAGAARKYEQVLALDEHAVGAAIRLLAVHCGTDVTQAEHDVKLALRLDPQSWQLWFERSRCALQTKRIALADSYAREALRLSPTRPEVSLLAANVASQLHDSAREAALLFGAVALNPGQAPLWLAIIMSPTLPSSYRRYAIQRYLDLRPPDASWIPPTFERRRHGDLAYEQRVAGLREQFEQALARRDTIEARRIAVLLGLHPDDLAGAALKWGCYALALDQAKRLLALEPSDGRAWVIALVAADLAGDTQQVAHLLEQPPTRAESVEPSLLAALLDLLERRTQLVQVP
jgi:tetratricopeptide (TPR) repeat protein